MGGAASGAGDASGDAATLARSVSEAAIVAEAVNAARDLQNRPANDLTPTALVAHAQALAEQIEGLSVESEGREGILARGMGAFAAVAQGSEQEPALITLRYEGRARIRRRGPVLGLVGKAVTFDSGGISLKPGAKMSEMKFDMSGGAAVIEAIGAIARLGLPVKLVGVVGATENLPSGRAVKPGDIVTSAAGKTIEVNNTDAEGRLVLADCLHHAVSLGAERIVDLATLTGAVIVALGSTYAGLLANDDEFAQAHRRGGRAQRRDRVAAAAARGVRRADQGPLRRSEQRPGGAQGGHDRRRGVPVELRRGDAVGAPRHRGLGLGSGSRVCPEERVGLWRAPAGRAGALLYVAPADLRCETGPADDSPATTRRVAGMDFDLSPDHELIRRTVREFAEGEVAPVAEELDRTKSFPYEIVAKLGALNLMGIPFPQEYGGAGADTLAYALAVEELTRVDSSVAITLCAHTSLGTQPIYLFGSEAQKREWLPRLCAGESLGAFGLTEPEAGSDAGNTRTRARLRGRRVGDRRRQAVHHQRGDARSRAWCASRR